MPAESTESASGQTKSKNVPQSGGGSRGSSKGSSKASSAKGSRTGTAAGTRAGTPGAKSPRAATPKSPTSKGDDVRTASRGGGTPGAVSSRRSSTVGTPTASSRRGSTVNTPKGGTRLPALGSKPSSSQAARQSGGSPKTPKSPQTPQSAPKPGTLQDGESWSMDGPKLPQIGETEAEKAAKKLREDREKLNQVMEKRSSALAKFAERDKVLNRARARQATFHREVRNVALESAEQVAWQYLFEACRSGYASRVRELVREPSAPIPDANSVVNRDVEVELQYIDWVQEELGGGSSALKGCWKTHKIDVNTVGGKLRRTALHAACSNGHLDVVKLLCEDFEADTDRTDSTGRTPVWEAAKNGYQEVVLYLIDAGAAGDTPDIAGNSPLHMAVKGGFAGIVQVLVDAGADLLKVNKEGVMAKDMYGKHLHLAAYLQGVGKVQRSIMAPLEQIELLRDEEFPVDRRHADSNFRYSKGYVEFQRGFFLAGRRDTVTGESYIVRSVDGFQTEAGVCGPFPWIESMAVAKSGLGLVGLRDGRLLRSMDQFQTFTYVHPGKAHGMGEELTDTESAETMSFGAAIRSIYLVDSSRGFAVGDADPRSDAPLLAAARKLFAELDDDRSGTIEAGEFQKLAKALGYSLTPTQLETVMKILDRDASGTIEFPEFFEWHSQQVRQRSPEPVLLRTRNGGHSFERVTIPHEALELCGKESLSLIDVAFGGESDCFGAILGRYGEGHSLLLTSTDHGNSWQFIEPRSWYEQEKVRIEREKVEAEREKARRRQEEQAELRRQKEAEDAARHRAAEEEARKKVATPKEREEEKPKSRERRESQASLHSGLSSRSLSRSGSQGNFSRQSSTSSRLASASTSASNSKAPSRQASRPGSASRPKSSAQKGVEKSDSASLPDSMDAPAFTPLIPLKPGSGASSKRGQGKNPFFGRQDSTAGFGVGAKGSLFNEKAAGQAGNAADKQAQLQALLDAKKKAKQEEADAVAVKSPKSPDSAQKSPDSDSPKTVKSPNNEDNENTNLPVTADGLEIESERVDETDLVDEPEAPPELKKQATEGVLSAVASKISTLTRDGSRLLLLGKTSSGDGASEMGDDVSEFGDDQSEFGDDMSEMGDAMSVLSPDDMSMMGDEILGTELDQDILDVPDWVEPVGQPLEPTQSWEVRPEQGDGSTTAQIQEAGQKQGIEDSAGSNANALLDKAAEELELQTSGLEGQDSVERQNSQTPSPTDSSPRSPTDSRAESSASPSSPDSPSSPTSPQSPTASQAISPKGNTAMAIGSEVGSNGEDENQHGIIPFKPSSGQENSRQRSLSPVRMDKGFERTQSRSLSPSRKVAYPSSALHDKEAEEQAGKADMEGFLRGALNVMASNQAEGLSTLKSGTGDKGIKETNQPPSGPSPKTSAPDERLKLNLSKTQGSSGQKGMNSSQLSSREASARGNLSSRSSATNASSRQASARNINTRTSSTSPGSRQSSSRNLPGTQSSGSNSRQASARSLGASSQGGRSSSSRSLSKTPSSSAMANKSRRGSESRSGTSRGLGHSASGKTLLKDKAGDSVGQVPVKLRQLREFTVDKQLEEQERELSKALDDAEDSERAIGLMLRQAMLATSSEGHLGGDLTADKLRFEAEIMDARRQIKAILSKIELTKDTSLATLQNVLLEEKKKKADVDTKIAEIKSEQDKTSFRGEEAKKRRQELQDQLEELEHEGEYFKNNIEHVEEAMEDEQQLYSKMVNGRPVVDAWGSRGLEHEGGVIAGGRWLSRVAVSASGNVIVAGPGGIQVSKDGGRRWERSLPILSEQDAQAISTVGDVVYGVVKRELYRSEDGALSWTHIGRLPPLGLAVP